MFLASIDSGRQAVFDDPNRLATMGTWQRHYGEPRYDYSTPDIKDNWAELAATRDALRTGTWSSGSRALDLTIATYQYGGQMPATDLLRFFSGLSAGLLTARPGELAASITHYGVSQRDSYWPVLRMAKLGGVDPVVTYSKGSEATVALATGGSHLRAGYRPTSGEDPINFAVLSIGRDLPIHGLFARTPKEITATSRHPYDFVTAEESANRTHWRDARTVQTLPGYEVFVGDAAVAGMVDRTLQAAGTTVHNHLLERMSRTLGVPISGL